jgi:2-dehydro-3-deoxyphosphogalactonate aldolase
LNALADTFHQYRTECPIIAILRGITPDEIVAIGDALTSAGVKIIEIPLNSPDPLESIRRLSQALGDRALVGAGTVLNIDDVANVKDAGGQLVVSPNTDTSVIAATLAASMISIPGYFTPTEAFVAIHAGAHAIKLFPAEAARPAVLKAQRAVLPKHVPMLIVGGVTADEVSDWLSAGADGFGLGGALYRPGHSAAEVRQNAAHFVDALRQRVQQ